MKNMLAITLLMLATLVWAVAQQPGSAAERSSGQATSPSSQAPGATQPQPSTPGSADRSAPQASNAPVTEGCLGGSDPNYTLTDKANITYKLNIPTNADTSKLASHVGESVQVAGDVKDAGKTGNPTIDVQGIGRGTGKCPTSQAPPKQ